MYISVAKFLLILLATVLILASFIGMGIYGAYTKFRGPIWLRNQFIGVWLSLLLCFYSFQTIYLLVKRSYRFKKCYFFFDLCYYVLITLAIGLITVCYGLIVRVDSIVFAGVTTLICFINLCILMRRRNKSSLSKAQKMYIPTIDQDIENSQSEMFKNENEHCCKSFARFLNLLLKLIFLIIVGLLTNGAVIYGTGSYKYKPRGSFVDVPLADTSNRILKIHYLCDGPKNSLSPTIFFEGDASHGYADYLDLQQLLAAKNRRSCIWDKAGLGFSDFLYADMYNYSLYYHNFISSLPETKPFIFVGWGGGGSLVYDYALKHPEMVHSITLLDAYPAKIEWTVQASLKNWTSDQFNKNMNDDINQRLGLTYLINAFGVPLGLMPLIPLGPKSNTSSFNDEKNWFFYTEKTWVSQKYFLEEMSKEVDIFETKPNQTIKINHIMSVKSDQQIVKQICEPKKLAFNSTGCLYEKSANWYMISTRQNLVQNGRIYECNLDECNQGYFVYDQPQFTVKALLELYP